MNIVRLSYLSNESQVAAQTDKSMCSIKAKVIVDCRVADADKHVAQCEIRPHRPVM